MKPFSLDQYSAGKLLVIRVIGDVRDVAGNVFGGAVQAIGAL